MIEANGTSDVVAKKVATAIFKAKQWPGVVMLDIDELAKALEYAIDIYSGNAEKVFGKPHPSNDALHPNGLRPEGEK